MIWWCSNDVFSLHDIAYRVNLSGSFDRLIEAYPENEWLILWETNRGCPFKCTFCDWGSATASKVNKFDLERLKLEIDWFSKNKIEFIFCCDANFGILKRDIEIAEYVAIKKKRTGCIMRTNNEQRINNICTL